MNIRVETNSSEMQEYLRRVEGDMHTSLTRALQRAAIMVQQHAALEVPVAFGKLRQSIANEVVEIAPGKYEARVGTTNKYAKYVEFGTSPHLVVGDKDSPIGKWILRKMTFVSPEGRKVLKAGGKAGKQILDRLAYMKKRLQAGEKVGIRVSGRAQPFLVPSLEERRAEILAMMQKTIGEQFA